ncbi:MAG: EamA family transporter [Gemmatimonadota bacterium]|nr:EamA family transporter [Gemmatimonadota bacterium]
MRFPAMSGSETSASSVGAPEASTVLVIAAFAAVYVIWGSTYLAIRFAIESIPPLFMASVRFLVAGALLHAWSLLRGGLRPTWPQWRGAAIAGALMLGAGNGAVVIAEQWVPSGVTAVLVACVPLWMVVFDAAFFSKTRPSVRAQGGLLVGFAGVALLAGTPGVGGDGLRGIFGVVLLLGGSAGWAAGSLYLRQLDAPRDALLWVSMQMLMGGTVLGILSVATLELPDVNLGQMSGRSLASLLYLIVFGAIIAYSAYVWLLRVTTPARVGTYAYVNPVIALFLGWALADEPISLPSVVAVIVILGSVVAIVSERRNLGVRGVTVGQASK